MTRLAALAVGLLAALPTVLGGAVPLTTVTGCVPSPRAFPPKKLHCNVQSIIHKPQSIGNQTTDVLADCAAACFQEPNCVSFGFASSNGTCELFSVSLNAQRWHRSSTSPWIYANRNCYFCPQRGPYNAGFETGGTLPWNITDIYYGPNSSATFTITSPGFNGSQYAAQFNLTDAIGYGAYIDIAQGVTLQPATSYIASFAYQILPYTILIPDYGPFGQVYFNVLDSSGNLNQQSAYVTFGAPLDSYDNPIGTWNVVELPFFTGSAQEITISVGGFVEAAIFVFNIDSITLKRSPPLPAGTHVYNGDFDSGSLQPWIQGDNVGNPGIDIATVTIAQPGEGGSGYAVNLTTLSRSGSNQVYVSLTQQVTLPANTTCNFTMQYYREFGSTLYNQLAANIVPVQPNSYVIYGVYTWWESDGDDTYGNPPGVWASSFSGSFTTGSIREHSITVSTANGAQVNSGFQALVDNIQVTCDT